MKRLAMVSAVNPYPTDAGKKVVLAGLLDYFVTRLSAQNVHYLLIGGKTEVPFPVSLTQINGPTPYRALMNLIGRTAVGQRSIQEAFLWSRSTHRAVNRWFQEVDAHIEIYDTVRTAQFASESAGPTRICYMDDLFSERYASMLSALRADKTIRFRPLGNFGAHVPQQLHFLTENPITQKALLTAEARLVAKSENNVARTFDRCLLVNEHETDLLQKRGGASAQSVKTISPLVKTPAMVKRDYRGAPQFLFLGLLSLPHNDYGLRSFISDTWPLVLRRMPGAQLKVIGREPQPELSAAISKYGAGSISLQGFVPDLRSLMSQSAAMVNPLRFGSGIKLKIVEALGQRLPVVSSEIGASGVLSGPENGVLLAKEPEEWVDHLEQLTSSRHNSDVSAAAEAHFARIYSREAVFASYDNIFGLG